jgi:hypothetical protein
LSECTPDRYRLPAARRTAREGRAADLGELVLILIAFGRS